MSSCRAYPASEATYHMLLTVVVSRLLAMLLLKVYTSCCMLLAAWPELHGAWLPDQQLMRHAQVTHPDFSTSQDLSGPGATPANSPMAVPRAEPEEARPSRFSTAESQPQAQLQELLAAEKVSRKITSLPAA